MGEESMKEEVIKFNVIEHELVPKHEVMSPEEVKALLKRYHVRLEQLPQILTSDPLVRILGAKPGDVIKITRKSPISGISYYYRCVVRGEG